MRKKIFVLASLLVTIGMIAGACAPQTATPGAPSVTEVVVTVPVMVEGTPMVVTATPPPPPPPAEFNSSDPNTLSYVTFGEPESFDPALDYESAGGEVIQNIYEGLIFYNRDNPVEFIPQLATEVPTIENGGISEDGKTYTFNIRQGVTFHNGNDLTPSDVAYSFQRGLLQGGTASPQWLLVEPFFGIGMDDISLLVDPEGNLYDDAEGMQAADPQALTAACEQVKAAIVADDANWTVTMNLSQAWAPFIPTLAGYWGSIMDQEWVVENGGWDGSCDTWQNFYAMTSQNDPFTPITNGTGPYMLDHWTQGQEIVMVRNDNYWRTEPAWEGGPSGPASIERIIIKKVDEWGTRFAMAQAGDADIVQVNRQDVSQIDPLVGETCSYDINTNDLISCEATSDQPMRLHIGYTTGSRTDVFFNFDIANPEGGNPFIGSGRLDGNGIPPDFFSDEHVRKAFNYCFDFDVYIQDALVGEAIQTAGIPLPGMPGYETEGAKYTFDPARCEEEFRASELQSPDGQSLWDVGFRLQVAYNTGNITRQTVAEILGTTLSTMNELFQVEVIGLPWPTFLRNQRAQTLPLYISGWGEDIHDPHNFYVPYLTGTYGRLQNLPEDILAQFSDLTNQGVAETDSAGRAEIYQQLNQQVFDLAPQILLPIAFGRTYTQRWVDGWYYNPMYSNNYYYALSKQ